MESAATATEERERKKREVGEDSDSTARRIIAVEMRKIEEDAEECGRVRSKGYLLGSASHVI